MSAATYDPHTFWNERHQRLGFTLRAVGDRGLTEGANRTEYHAARAVFWEVLAGLEVPQSDLVLDAGYGTGYYLAALASRGFSNLWGVDIVARQQAAVRARVPGANLLQADLCAERVPLTGVALLVCLDVTLHMPAPSAFRYFLRENVARMCAGGGIFLVADGPSDHFYNYYQRAHSLETFQRELPEAALVAGPVDFHRKHLWALRVN